MCKRRGQWRGHRYQLAMPTATSQSKSRGHTAATRSGHTAKPTETRPPSLRHKPSIEPSHEPSHEAESNTSAEIRFLKDRGSRAEYVTSVCTGSLILGAAGLLTGYKATSHWATTSLLPIFAAIPTEGRFVQDRNRITCGGVTAGIDFGLSLVGTLRGREYAECVQLMAEYAPEPPYDAGTPKKAPPEVTKMIDDMFVDFLKQARDIGRTAYATHGAG